MPSYFKVILLGFSMLALNALVYQNCSPTTFTSDSAQLVQGKEQVQGTGVNTSPPAATPPLDAGPPINPPINAPINPPVNPSPSPSAEVGLCITPIPCSEKRMKQSCGGGKNKNADKNLINKEDDDDKEYCSDDEHGNQNDSDVKRNAQSELGKIAPGQVVSLIQLKDAGMTTAVNLCMSRQACELANAHVNVHGDLGDDDDKDKDDKDKDDDKNESSAGQAPTVKTIFKPMPAASCTKIISDSDFKNLLSSKKK